MAQFSDIASDISVRRKAWLTQLIPTGSDARIQFGRFVVIGGFLLLWQLSSGPLLDPFYVSTPSAIAVKIVSEFVSAGFYRDLYVTSIELFVGYAIGAASGVGIGVLLARWPTLAQIFDPIFVALNSIPRVALAPLLIVWLGIDLAPKIVLGATLVFFLTFFNTLAGIRNVSPGLVDVARVLGATDWQIFHKVMLPAAAPWIMTGLKMSLPFALIGVIVGEFLAASSGLGFRLNYYSTSYNTTGTFAMLFIMMGFMMALNAVIVAIEKRVLKWRPRSAFQVDAAL